LNDGDGTFADITESAGLGDPRFNTSAVFVDFDGDGLLDLYVCSYVQLPNPLEQITCRNPAGGLQYCDVHLYDGAQDLLYRNNGDLTFTDVSRQAGIAGRSLRGLAVLCADYDGDGLPDIFVANDEHPMLLWHNQGDGTFREAAAEAGVAYDGQGKVVAGMGLDMAYLDGSERLALYQSNFQSRPNILFEMESSGWFVDRTQKWGLGQPTIERLAFGVGFLDYDLDGWRDLVMANGHVIDDIQQFQPHIPYEQPAQLFRNQGGGGFTETSSALGEYATLGRVGRGALLGDFDNDGALDVLFTNNNQPPALLRNLARERDPRAQWTVIRCLTETGRDAYGAVVTLTAGGRTQIAEARAAAGYLGSNDPRVNFGLASAGKIDSLFVTWPGGKREAFGEQPVGQLITLRQGAGRNID
jgi:enediyne biosynthesis protein E4